MSFTGFARSFGILGFNLEAFSTSATGTATIPLDDTQPDITEGTQFSSVDYTPTITQVSLGAGGILLCSSNTALRTAIVAVFAGSTCIAVSAFHFAAANVLAAIPVFGLFNTESLSTITFSLRAGLSAAGTIQVNNNGAQVFDGVATSYLQVTEFKFSS